eukprot:TRINITY_DN2213_c0_g1_i4.p1 TRINITY_DN2213_c0_g1~~TRINITY_DN2213_c0_g1_i4.p1  ORF type:complete len:1297 (+),score=419.02 TRINITY_DN2213_c0_g1_i4:80-3970(+)
MTVADHENVAGADEEMPELCAVGTSAKTYSTSDMDNMTSDKDAKTKDNDVVVLYSSGKVLNTSTAEDDIEDDGFRVRIVDYDDLGEFGVMYGPFVPGYYGFASSESDHPWGYFDAQNKAGYLGLSNQGATCYMNSLLQTLYMTPEFRSALFEWRYQPEKDGEDTMCIPYQLQILFANLQLSERPWLETKDLTRSFGWSTRDAFQQHDVQELNRVLMDALESTFTGTPYASKIQDLYKGTMSDFLHCTQCKHTRERDEIFMDISLVIRNVRSVEESLKLFVEPERLDGSNQYFCERCAGKVDALKGLALKHIPYLLTLQLKRFDFDYETFERVKLNDEVTFPMQLDMRPFVQNKINQDGTGQEATSLPPPPPRSECTAADQQYELFSVLVHSGGAGSGHYYSYIKDFATGEWYTFNDSHVTPLSPDAIKNVFGNSTEQKTKPMTEDEANNVRTGDIIIPDDDDDIPALESPDATMVSGQDGNTSMETLDDTAEMIETESGTPGGPPKLALHKLNTLKDSSDNNKTSSGTESSSSSSAPLLKSSANAYMLMYRLIDPTRNVNTISEDQVPPALREQIELENVKYISQREEHRIKRDTIKLRVYNMDDKSTVHTISISKKRTLLEATAEAYKTMKIEESGLPLDCVRLRSYSSFTGVPGDTFPGKAEATLESLSFYNMKDLILESKAPGTEFPEHNENNIMLRLYKYNSDAKDSFDPPVDVFIEKDMKFADFKLFVADRLKIPRGHARMWELRYVADHLVGDHKSMSGDFGLVDGDKLHVEEAENPDNQEGSQILYGFEHQKYTINIKFNHPDNPEDYLYTISIDKRLPMRALKEEIARVVGLQVGEFRIRRASSTMYEFKDDSQTIQQACLYEASKVLVERGKPLAVDHYWFKFFGSTKNRSLEAFFGPMGPKKAKKDKDEEATPETQTQAQAQTDTQMDTSSEPATKDEGQAPTKEEGTIKDADGADLPVHEVTLGSSSPSSSRGTTLGGPVMDLTVDSSADESWLHLFDLPIKGDVTISELKALLLRERQSQLFDIPLEHMRLREKLGNYASKIFKNDKTLKQCVKYLYDGKELVIEKTEMPEDLKAHEVVITIQRYHPRTRHCSNKREFIVNKRRPATEFRDAVSAASGIPHADLALSTPFWAEPANPDAAQWEHILDTDVRSLAQVMWHMKDGELVLYKDETEDDPSVMVNKGDDVPWTTSRLHGSVAAASVSGDFTAKSAAAVAKSRPKEVGIKIRGANATPEKDKTAANGENKDKAPEEKDKDKDKDDVATAGAGSGVGSGGVVSSSLHSVD